MNLQKYVETTPPLLLMQRHYEQKGECEELVNITKGYLKVNYSIE